MPTSKKPKNPRVIAALVESSDEDIQVTAPPLPNESAEKPLVYPVDDDDGPATSEAPLHGDDVASTAADAPSPDNFEAPVTADSSEAVSQPPLIAVLRPIVAGAAAPSVAATAADLVNKSTSTLCASFLLKSWIR